jgi:hypothetical protein
LGGAEGPQEKTMAKSHSTKAVAPAKRKADPNALPDGKQYVAPVLTKRQKERQDAAAKASAKHYEGVVERAKKMKSAETP